MATSNEEFFDALVRHQILLLALSKRMQRRVRAILNRTEEDIRRQIRLHAGPLASGTSTANVRRIRAIMKVITATRLTAWDQIQEEWLEQLQDLAVSEASFIDNALKTTAPAVLETVIPNVTLLRSLASQSPVQGSVLRDWFRTLARSDARRIESAIMVGMVQGESPVQISRRIVGSARLRGANGMTEITRRHAISLARTAALTVSNNARSAFLAANAELFTEEMYVATLDSRTTPICRSLDNKTFPVGSGPHPPLHFNCRSLRVAVIDGIAMGRRPARAFTQQQLLREYARANGLGTIGSRSALPRGHKGAFDSFARQRMRELTGQVPGDLSYQDWLQRQSASFQDDVLGPTRGALFRRGDLTLDRFVSPEGHEFTLSELVRRDRQAFLDAGLDPDDFT